VKLSKKIKNMKTKILHFFVTSFFLGIFPVKTVALNYTITFTGTGASTMVDNVTVQNLTKGISVTVSAGNVLNLSDTPNAVEKVNVNDGTICVYPASTDGKSIVSFFAKQTGSTQFDVFSLDGKKIVGIRTDLHAGINTFELSLLKGVYVIQVTGNEYEYSTKLLNSSGTQSKPEIGYIGTEKPSAFGQQKSKSSILGGITMPYTAGDQLLYKAVSGNYSTIVTDVPTGSKITNFNFVACTDADGNNYTVVTIGTQTWMAENLKTTKYRNGDPILNVTENTSWNSLTTGAYCWYDNDATTYKNTYGALYNWFAVNTGKLAPIGWHVPTDAEWTALTDYFGGETVAGDKLKETGINNWISTNSVVTNESGFTALPGGMRGGSDYFRGKIGYWWSSTLYMGTHAWQRFVSVNNSLFYRNWDDETCGGLSIRCIKE